MTLRKTTIDNSGRYVLKREQIREIKQNTIKNNTTPRKQNKKISQKNKKILNNISASAFNLLERIMNCYF